LKAAFGFLQGRQKGALSAVVHDKKPRFLQGSVMRGLDPRTHHPSKKSFESSPFCEGDGLPGQARQ
jgi:hypothetical protein